MVHAVLTPDHKDVVFQDSYRGGSSEVRILVPGALFQEVTIQPDQDAIFVEPPIASREASWAWQRLSPYMTDPVVTSELRSLDRRLLGAERETIERTPWPIEGEAIYRKAFGEDRIKRRKSLLTLGGWRPHYAYVYQLASFAGPMGNAWLDSSAREQLLRCVGSDPKTPVLNAGVTKLYAQIENEVMHPGKKTSDVEWAEAVTKWREWTIEKAVKEALMRTKP